MKLRRILIAAFTAAAVAVCGAMLAGCGNTGKTARLVFDSFDGGGPEYTAVVGDTSIVSCASERKYAKADHEQMTGAGYDVIFTLTGLKPGSTTLTVSSFSPIVGSEEYRYTVTVDEGLNVTAERMADEPSQ